MSKKTDSAETVDNYDYLSTASARECTGLIPSLPTSEAELESYNDIYQIYPPYFGKGNRKD